MKVVADASVLIGLGSIEQLTLLNDRFPQGILIPQAVWREVVEQGARRPGAQEVASATWIGVQPVTSLGIVRLLKTDIEEGEAEAIALAYEIDADLVLLDERAARRAAHRLGLETLGTIGMLMWAKQSGRVPNLKVLLDALQTQGRFRISRTLYAQALNEVGE